MPFRLPNILNVYSCTVALFILATLLCLKGLPGNPTPNGTGIEKILVNKPPFESSLERGRFAQIIALADYGTVNVDEFVDFLKPDLAWYNGHYYPAFPPGISLLAVPLYLLGKSFHLSQVGTFLFSSVFTLATIILIFQIGKELGLSRKSKIFSAILYAFGSTAFVYSVTLSAHTLSAAIIAACALIYLRLRKEPSTLLFAALWFLFTINLFIDYPNLFILLPLLIAAIITSIKTEHTRDHAKISFTYSPLLGSITAVIVFGIFVAYNFIHYDRPVAFTNMFNLKSLEIRGIPFSYDHLSNDLFSKKSYGTRFQLTNLWRGIRVLLFSHDRGLFLYSPAFLAAIVGFLAAIRNKTIPIFVFGLTILFDIIIYGSFDDPWGGWSFGPRYLIPVLPLFAIMAGVGYDRIVKKIGMMKIVLTILLLVGIGISLLGALTTTTVPPSVEAAPLHMPDNFLLNWQLLQNGMNSAFLYKIFFYQFMTPLVYWVSLFVFFSTTTVLLLFVKTKKYETIN